MHACCTLLHRVCWQGKRQTECALVRLGSVGDSSTKVGLLVANDHYKNILLVRGSLKWMNVW